MEIIAAILSLIGTGAPSALNAVLFAGIVYLLWERRIFNKQLSESFEKLDAVRDKNLETTQNILDKYYNGNIQMIQALNEIKIVLATMQKSID